jgi:hypothetical protein
MANSHPLESILVGWAEAVADDTNASEDERGIFSCRVPIFTSGVTFGIPRRGIKRRSAYREQGPSFTSCVPVSQFSCWNGVA